MRNLEKSNLHNSSFLNHHEMKDIIGGYEPGYELPEFVIECGATEGKCWKFKKTGSWLGFENGYCEFTGKQSDYYAVYKP